MEIRILILEKKTKKKGLRRWFNENWVNQRGEVGYKYKYIYSLQKELLKNTNYTL